MDINQIVGLDLIFQNTYDLGHHRSYEVVRLLITRQSTQSASGDTEKHKERAAYVVR